MDILLGTGAVSRFQEDDLNFGIVIDAGSSGSRAYLYKWTNANHEDSLPNIEPMMDNGNEPLMKSVSPGLSRFYIPYPPMDLDVHLKLLKWFQLWHGPH